MRKQDTLSIQVFSLAAGRYQAEWRHAMAATPPVALLFAWLQKYLIGRLGVGAVK
jgi:multiple sugar transport system permease protein